MKFWYLALYVLVYIWGCINKLSSILLLLGETRGFFMDTKMVDITLHIDENTTHDKRETFRDSLLNLNGVMTADCSDRRPHLMVVGYDPDAINSSELLIAATHNGLHAELIGF